ncbi:MULTISPECIES: nutrient deprivation-induced protein [unclassified Devosia]|uniref:nutrient deprivation-induced protein n=1 Tax=unclassified Devosia TaxID=196773 RepID=UPI00145ECC18|nr:MULTISPECIES: nutrient deprivation-induced protein [unclassified Devosia]MBJ6989198.1 nutrient deprivation-induced protein [Devosia sp. MC521]QMW62448.1 nutrient deprivation-induced protein [Devosia sp. MC521]
MSTHDLNGSNGQQIAPTSQLQDQVKTDAAALANQAKHDLDSIGQRAKEDVRKLGNDVGEKLTEATDQVRSFAGDQKDLAAGQINGIAVAISKVANELTGNDQRVVARYARDIASGLSTVGRTIEERDVDDLMGLAQDFGRKQPVAFLGAAVLAGFVASRFALASNLRRTTKSSAESEEATASNASAPGTTQPMGGQ